LHKCFWIWCRLWLLGSFLTHHYWDWKPFLRNSATFT
jgi:hypothetical protein